MRELRDNVTGAMREPRRGRDVPADEDARRPPAQGRQLHHGHSRLEEEVCRPRTLSVRPTQKVWRNGHPGK